MEFPRMSVTAGAAASLILFAFAGCTATSVGTSPGNSPISQKSLTTKLAVINPSVVRGSAHYDYEPFSSIVSAARAAEAGAVGEVVSWSNGRTLTDGDDVDYSAVLKIRVTDPVQPVGISDDFLYVEVRRGGEILVDGKPFRHAGAPAAYRTIAELSRAVPTGTRVIVLGLIAPSDHTLETESVTGKVSNSGAGLPSGATLVSPFPQGLIFETAEGGFASGYADGESQWGWLSDDVPDSQRFAALVKKVIGHS